MNTAMDVASVVLFIILIMYAAIKLDEAARGYTHSETMSITHADGREAVKMNTKWTQKGRLFLYDMLKKEDIVPVIERGA